MDDLCPHCRQPIRRRPALPSADAILAAWLEHFGARPIRPADAQKLRAKLGVSDRTWERRMAALRARGDLWYFARRWRARDEAAAA